MPDPKQEPAAPVAAKEMTAAQAAKLVFRPPAKDDGKPVAIKAAEVFAFRDYGTHVVVVTVDGQKFTSEQAE